MIAQISISAKERDCKPYPIIIEIWMRGNTIKQHPRLEKKPCFHIVKTIMLDWLTLQWILLMDLDVD